MRHLLSAILTLAFVASLTTSCSSEPAEENKTPEPSKEARERAEARKVPQIVWQDLHQKDTIPFGETYEATYTFFSTGYEPVVIKDAVAMHPECTCTIPSDSIVVGGEGKITLKCDFTEKGYRAFNIQVSHNSPQKDFILTAFLWVGDVEDFGDTDQGPREKLNITGGE